MNYEAWASTVGLTPGSGEYKLCERAWDAGATEIAVGILDKQMANPAAVFDEERGKWNVVKR